MWDVWGETLSPLLQLLEVSPAHHVSLDRALRIAQVVLCLLLRHDNLVRGIVEMARDSAAPTVGAGLNARAFYLTLTACDASIFNVVISE